MSLAASLSPYPTKQQVKLIQLQDGTLQKKFPSLLVCYCSWFVTLFKTFNGVIVNFSQKYIPSPQIFENLCIFVTFITHILCNRIALLLSPIIWKINLHLYVVGDLLVFLRRTPSQLNGCKAELMIRLTNSPIYYTLNKLKKSLTNVSATMATQR